MMVKHSLNVPRHSTDLPRRILYPTDFFPLPDPMHQKLVESLMEKLEAYLGIKRVEINLAHLWEDDPEPPSGSDTAAGKSLQDYMNKVRFSSAQCLIATLKTRLTVQ